MKLTFLFVLLLVAAGSDSNGSRKASAFVVVVDPAASSSRRTIRTATAPPLRMATTESDRPIKEPLMDMPSTKEARERLLETCKRLKAENGVLLLDKQSKDEFRQAVEDLESLVSEPPTATEEAETELVGEWDLLCSTSTKAPAVDKSSLPSFLFESGPLQKIREKIRESANKFITVQQVIKVGDTGERYDAGGDKKSHREIDRIDHVLRYKPPKQLRELLVDGGADVPEQLANLDINPFDVKESKLVLVHKASIVKDDDDEKKEEGEDDDNALKIKLTLKSIVLNVAGTSQYLDPDGKDLFGINLPLADFVADSDFLNSARNGFGEFTTTYLDRDLRVSRSHIGPRNGDGPIDVGDDQIRVFVRAGSDDAVDAGVEEAELVDFDVTEDWEEDRADY